MHLEVITKIFLSSIIVLVICYSFLFLFNHDAQFQVFLSQSIIDNAVFCVMFIAVLKLTGINC